MATIVNTPGTTNTEPAGNSGIVIAISLIAIFAVLFLLFGLPAMRGGGSGSGGAADTGGGADTAAPQGGSATINVPDRVNVDVNR